MGCQKPLTTICSHNCRPANHACREASTRSASQVLSTCSISARVVASALEDGLVRLLAVGPVDLLRAVIDLRELGRRLAPADRLEAVHLLTFEFRVVGYKGSGGPSPGITLLRTRRDDRGQQSLFLGAGEGDHPGDGRT